MNPPDNYSKVNRDETSTAEKGRMYYPPPPYVVYYPMEQEKPLDDDFTFDPTYQFSAFDERKVRHNFISKVFGITMMQLTVTALIVAAFKFYAPIGAFIKTHPYLWWVAFGVSIITLLCISCCEKARRKTPLNYILLFIFTLSQSVTLGVFTSYFDTEILLMAVAICSGVCLVLTVFALQTKWDFTTWGGGLLVALFILLVFGIIAVIFPGRTITLIYSCLGALLFCIYLVYDIQLMMGGHHSYSISPEEYICASLNLYLDVVNIFMHFLAIINFAK